MTYVLNEHIEHVRMVLRRCEILLLKKSVLIENGLSQSEMRSKEEIRALPLSPRRIFHCILADFLQLYL